jgi:hypothetical protein
VPGPVCAVAGLLTIVFQGMIMASGNLSWLNLLTMVLAIPALNDRWLAVVLPFAKPGAWNENSFLQMAVYLLGALVAVMSVRPIRNMLSADQAMNMSYNPLHLVGTYGAFGGITRTRYEVVVEGTEEAAVTPATVWREYEFKGKPGALGRRPRQVAPYHLRIDWLMWFAAMDSYYQHSWFVPMISKLLQGDPGMLSLLQSNPFPEKPPHFVRARLYEYHFTSPAEKKKNGQWWTRSPAGSYFPPASLDSHQRRS